jgi:hypothetical protein
MTAQPLLFNYVNSDMKKIHKIETIKLEKYSNYDTFEKISIKLISNFKQIFYNVTSVHNAPFLFVYKGTILKTNIPIKSIYINYNEPITLFLKKSALKYQKNTLIKPPNSPFENTSILNILTNAVMQSIPQLPITPSTTTTTTTTPTPSTLQTLDLLFPLSNNQDSPPQQQSHIENNVYIEMYKDELETMNNMGFGQSNSIEALKNTEGNISEAINLLLFNV